MSSNIPMGQPKYLMLHVTDSQPGMTVAQLQAVFRANGWSRPGYHVAVLHDASVHRLQDNSLICNGTKPYRDITNRNTFHIVTVGGRLGRQTGIDTRTGAQAQSVENVVKWYLANYPNLQVIGHNQVAAKLCPIYSVPDWARAVGIPEQNIYQHDHFGVLKYLKTGKW